MGETREERIMQFLEENETPVIGLREGAMLRMEPGSLVFRGAAGARLFRRGAEPIELEAGASINLPNEQLYRKKGGLRRPPPLKQIRVLREQFPETAAERGCAHPAATG